MEEAGSSNLPQPTISAASNSASSGIIMFGSLNYASRAQQNEHVLQQFKSAPTHYFCCEQLREQQNHYI